jgi:hypothetical protein
LVDEGFFIKSQLKGSRIESPKALEILGQDYSVINLKISAFYRVEDKKWKLYSPLELVKNEEGWLFWRLKII